MGPMAPRSLINTAAFVALVSEGVADERTAFGVTAALGAAAAYGVAAALGADATGVAGALSPPG